ncbi:MAG TPA: hypothetical protein PK637_05705 [Flavobacteriales bacterium]|nr:hypothetical protein [Flavobacteriales bacterium]
MSFVSDNRNSFIFLLVAGALILLLPLMVSLPDETPVKNKTIDKDTSFRAPQSESTH